MKDKELKLNASGYYDEPCYKAITAAPKPGEIWTHAATGYHMLIVASLNGVCSTLRLTEVEREGCIPVTGRTLMFATPIMLGYSFENTLGQYVKTVKGEEFEKVKRGIVNVLGLQDVKAYVKELEIAAADMLEKEKEMDAQRNTIIDLTKRNGELLEERDKLLVETCGYGETIKRQADELQACHKEMVMMGNELKAATIGAEKTKVYKELYETLMDKVMKLAMRGEA